MNKYFKLIAAIVCLIFVDQFIKIIIDTNYIDLRFDILPKLISFKPYLNDKYSWINSLSNLGLSRVFHIILVLLLLVIITVVFDFARYHNALDKVSFLLFTFLYAGSFCSLIDKVFWGGSLDYICLEGFFIFDLKDVYLSIFDIIFISITLFNYRGLREMKGKAMIYYIKNYIRNRKGVHSS